jgi:hypothetical protein
MSAGIYLDACRDIAIENNQLKGNAVGINLTELCDANSTEIHYNDIAGNTEYGVNNRNALVRPEVAATNGVSLWVNATYNWWGNDTGPHDVTDPASMGTGDDITYYVLYDPWLAKPAFSSQYTYHLVPGWNLIGIPVDVSDYSIEGFFPASVRDGMLTLWCWNETAQEYNFYGTDPNDWYYTQYPRLTKLETGRGYWVEMKNEAYFAIEGSVPDSAPTSPLDLVDGWNLVSITGICPQSVSGMYPDAFTVWTWNQTTQEYNFYGSDPDDWYYTQYPAFTTIQPGQGNWVEMTGE